MKLFNLSPWVWLAILAGLSLIPALGVGGFTLRNLPWGMQAEFAVNKAPFHTVDASIRLNGQTVDLHGIQRCRLNPYPGLSEAPDFSFPDGLVKAVGPDHDIMLVTRGGCTENQADAANLHFTVIDRNGDEAAVYLMDSPQLAGSKISFRVTTAADWEQAPDEYFDNCDEDGFSNTGRIGVWHLPGDSYVGDMVSTLGVPPPSRQIDNVSAVSPSGSGEHDLTQLLRDWHVRTIVRDSNRACAADDSIIGKGCRSLLDTRLKAYTLAAIDGGAIPAIHIDNGSMTLGEQGVVMTKRTNGQGYAHNMHLALRSGERLFYVQRVEFCTAKVWRPE